MSYIGNQVTSVPFVIDTFSGDNVTTAFGPMVRAPASVASMAVYISGVYKTPGVDYTLDSNFIFFTNPPATGTNNIVVHHLGDGVMATQVPADGSVTPGKLAGVIIRANNIVVGQITGNLLGSGAVSGNNIGAGAVSGNNIGVGAISANNFAGGGITSNVLAPNLALTVVRTNETTNLFSTAPSGNINIDVVNTSLYFFTSNTTANVTFNLRANNTNTFDSVVRVGETVTVSVALRHSTVSGGRHTANVFIDGGLIATNRSNPDQAGANNIFYVGNNAPGYITTIPGIGFEMNLYTISVFKRAANTYTVMLSSTISQIG
jgi:hypothetical protein